ncbi:hypothetical protein GQ43DRAFT_474050 [Delitschia confertaspora ATCC 74209]|uniref:Uncharacterized protein n=1 Tax=Delitschia confertaspora ATCC 74209 TaxID=1513339 RepID=A0A9P4JKT6_9PLEO|nr:hypothetical protein GQ43DRAFT_474050 [Delitschia confertaspora ATCC 74209]
MADVLGMLGVVTLFQIKLITAAPYVDLTYILVQATAKARDTLGGPFGTKKSTLSKDTILSRCLRHKVSVLSVLLSLCSGASAAEPGSAILSACSEDRVVE